MTLLRRHATENIIISLSLLAVIVVIGVLFLIVSQIFISGIPSLSWYFITTPENATPGMGQGIANAIVGTIILSLFATVIAAPFGLGTAIYLKRYAPDNGVTRSFRFLLEVLSGTPSIVIGVFGFLIFVIYLKQVTGGYSLLAGGIALAILIMPVIERSIEDAIERVSPELEEGSYALGANKWQTIRGITIPTAFSGILTGLTLGFGRAAEESAIVILTAGYTQYMPEVGIHTVNGASGGIKLFPLQDQVATLPYAVYHAVQNPSLVKPSAGFAAAFVLVAVVFSINIAGKAFLSYGFGSGKSNKDSFLDSVKNKLIPKKKMDTPTIGPAGCLNDMPSKNKQKDVAKDTSPEKSSATFNPAPIVPEHITSVLDSPDDEKWWSEDDTPVPVTPSPDPGTSSQPPKKPHSLGAGIKQLSHAIRQGINILVHKIGEKRASGDATTVHGTTDNPASVDAGKPGNRGRLNDSLRSFFLTFIPFALVATILELLSFVLPGLSSIGSNGPAGALAVPIMALVLCAIGVVFSLFLVRGSTIFLLRHKKTKIGNRQAEYAAIITGICLILIVAFLFSAHVFTPPEHPVGSAASTETVTSGNSQTPDGSGCFGFFDLIFVPGQNLLGFLHLSGPVVGGTGATVTDSSNRSAKLAALLASGALGDTDESSATPTPAPVSAASTPSAAQVTSIPKGSQPIVTAKYYLDVGESYWYGDDTRPCLATVYNVTTLSHYYWWDFNWNRFAEQTPASTGDTFLVVFIRIEDTGHMTALVPAADDFILTNNGQTYTHNPFFDLSVFSQSQITHYSTDPQSVPYQWIREIGQQKRDYAFLTGYNIFGQNTTVVTNYTANSAASPPSPNTGNGQGFFIMPGSSNAIDGYLIYEVPDTVAADLKDTYVQVSFNSISPTRWRLGK
jgi:phosphate transport system permease protein